jgi:hypothetical protein
MKVMIKQTFQNLIHDLGCTPKQLFKDLQTYDNLRIIKLQQVDNKQYYNIIFLDGQGNEDDAKITYVCLENKKFISFQEWKKRQLNSVYGINTIPTMRVYAHYGKQTIEFKNVKTVYVQENYLMIVFEDDFKSIDLKECKSYTILDK